MSVKSPFPEIVQLSSSLIRIISSMICNHKQSFGKKL